MLCQVLIEVFSMMIFSAGIPAAIALAAKISASVVPVKFWSVLVYLPCPHENKMRGA